MREGRGPHDLAAAKLAVTSVLDHSEPTGFCRVEAITKSPRGQHDLEGAMGGLAPRERARSRALLVRVVVVPPVVRGSLRVAVRRVLPLLLAPERGDVEVAPGAAPVFVTAVVDEVGAVDLTVLADERVCPVPLADAEVRVEIVGDRVPGDVPAHALLQALDLGLGGARDERERGVPGVQVGRMRHLVGEEGTANAAPLRVRAAPSG